MKLTPFGLLIVPFAIFFFVRLLLNNDSGILGVVFAFIFSALFLIVYGVEQIIVNNIKTPRRKIWKIELWILFAILLIVIFKAL